MKNDDLIKKCVYSIIPVSMYNKAELENELNESRIYVPDEVAIAKHTNALDIKVLSLYQKKQLEAELKAALPNEDLFKITDRDIIEEYKKEITMKKTNS